MLPDVSLAILHSTLVLMVEITLEISLQKSIINYSLRGTARRLSFLFDLCLITKPQIFRIHKPYSPSDVEVKFRILYHRHD
jgi:hypothetical protein